MAPAEPLSGSAPQATEFPTPDYRQWQHQVDRVLRRTGLLGSDEAAPDPVEDVLATATYDGVTVHPLYTGQPGDPGYPGMPPFVRGSKPQGLVTEGWAVCQQHAHPDPVETNREILADLNHGVSSLWLRLGSGGLAIDDLPDALADVHLDMVGITLDAGDLAEQAATALWELARERDVPPGALRGNIGADPIGVRARTGQQQEFDAAIDLAARCARSYPGSRAITVDGLPYHEAGGSDAEELGCSLATAVAYLRALEPTLDVDTACGLLEFRYASTGDQFATIAKLRAARRLWERVTRACGVAEQLRGQQQHAVTSPAMLTQRDPSVNMLRTTIAAVAAGVGGAQSVTVLPFDAAIGLPDAFARRIARNTQSLLVEEAHLARVIDPAGGSWYVETRTEELATAAWEWFQRIEASGGIRTALDSGVIGERLASTRRQRQDAIAHRRDPITGVTEFPELDEQPISRRPAPDQPGGGLPRIRYAEEFERLRDASDAVLARTGERPTVFLATLGPIAAYTARAAFARNLFASGGIATSEAGPTESISEVLEAFAGAGTSIVCVCSNDDRYTERGGETVSALKAAGATHVLLAGAPADRPLADAHVFTGVNALEILRDLHRRLGVQR